MELNKQGRSDSLERNDVRILIPGRLVGLEHCRHKTGVTVDHDSDIKERETRRNFTGKSRLGTVTSEYRAQQRSGSIT